MIESTNSLATVIVTGGNSGLGYECARSLLNDVSGAVRWRVVVACRNLERGAQAVDRLRQEASTPDAGSRVEVMQLDLASLASVRAFVVELSRRLDAKDLPPLRGIVCNAGVQSGGKITHTADGFESTFGVNHLGHFLLVNLLLAHLTMPARVAVVSSGTHDPAKKTGVPAPAWNDPTELAKGRLGPAGDKDSPMKGGQRRYSTSKLANVLFAYELARRAQPGLTVTAFDPGLMPGTELVRDGSAPLQWIWHRVLPRTMPLLRMLISPNIHTPAESGAALARLITAPELKDAGGKYFEGKRDIPSSTESYDLALASSLWHASEALTESKA